MAGNSNGDQHTEEDTAGIGGDSVAATEGGSRVTAEGPTATAPTVTGVVIRGVEATGGDAGAAETTTAGIAAEAITTEAGVVTTEVAWSSNHRHVPEPAW